MRPYNSQRPLCGSMVAGALCLAPHGLSSTRQHCCLPQEARPIPAWPLRGPAGAGLCEAPCCSGRAACCAGRPRPGSRRARLHALLAAASSGAARQPCVLYDLHDRQTAYVRAWDWQKALVKRRLAALQAGRPAADELLLLQHPPVYTLGTGSTLANLRFDPGQPPFELHRTERGGEATYHGPGQLVVYPILDLRLHQADLHWYMRSLEEVCIRTLAELGLHGERIPGLTGTWCEGHKVAAQGVRARQWVTFHGLALNVAPDLSHFQAIIPCGIQGRPVGSVAQLLAAGRAPAGGPPAAGGAEGPYGALMLAARNAMLASFQDVFQLQLTPCGNTAAPEHELDAAVRDMLPP